MSGFQIQVIDKSTGVYPGGAATAVQITSPGLTPPPVAIAASRAALAVLATNLHHARLTEAHRHGMFSWQAGNYSTHVAADPGQAVFVASTLPGFGASTGCWVRDDYIPGGDIHLRWLGQDAERSAAVMAACRAEYDHDADTTGSVRDALIAALANVPAIDQQIDWYTAFNAAFPGHVLRLPAGAVKVDAVHQNLTSLWTMRGHKGSSFVLDGPSLALTASVFLNATQTLSQTTREDKGIRFQDFTVNGILRKHPRWLTRLDGSRITDPEADYVAGTGLLASGISGVSLTATVAGGVVTGVNVVSGGTGFKAHPTAPYVPSTVRLMFSGGGGKGAMAYGTISGGSIVSCTVEDGGEGYASAPSVTTFGGYADPSILTANNRRNANVYVGGAFVASIFITLRKAEACEVAIGFINRHTTCVADQGCRNNVYDLDFVRCGKEDGPFYGLSVQNGSGNGTAFAPLSGYLPTENPRVRINARDQYRMPMSFNPAAGGVVEYYRVRGCREGGMFIPEHACAQGGQIIIDHFDVKDVICSDTEARGIEFNGPCWDGRGSIIVRNFRIENCQGAAFYTPGARNLSILNGTLIDCSSAALDVLHPYGPFSERVVVFTGVMPIAATPVRPLSDQSLIDMGTLARSAVFGATAGQGQGSRNVVVSGVTMIDTLTRTLPRTVKLVKSGGGSDRASGLHFVGNDLTAMPASARGVNMVDGVTVPSVLNDTAVEMVIRDNRGHASEGPVIVTADVAAGAASMPVAVQIGFRPRLVRCLATCLDGAVVQQSHGLLEWDRAVGSYRSFGGISMSVDTAAQRGERHAALYRVLGTGGAVRASATVTGWAVNGFTYTPNNTSVAAELVFECWP